MSFQIDIVNTTADGLIMKVTADCRSVADVDQLIVALKAARHTLGPPIARGDGSLGGLRRAGRTDTRAPERDSQRRC